MMALIRFRSFLIHHRAHVFIINSCFTSTLASTESKVLLAPVLSTFYFISVIFIGKIQCKYAGKCYLKLKIVHISTIETRCEGVSVKKHVVVNVIKVGLPIIARYSGSPIMKLHEYSIVRTIIVLRSCTNVEQLIDRTHGATWPGTQVRLG